VARRASPRETAIQRKIEEQSGRGVGRIAGKTLLIDAEKIWLDEISCSRRGCSRRIGRTRQEEPRRRRRRSAR
jgi:hypothetical protein